MHLRVRVLPINCCAILQAVAKFKQALGIDPSRHDTLWCLGNAYTSQVPLALPANPSKPPASVRHPTPTQHCSYVCRGS